MSAPEKTEMIAEGKAKKIYATTDPTKLIFYFKDDATAFNAQKKGTIESKGMLNQRISARLFTLLKGLGIDNHYVATLSDREMLVERLQIIPVETILRNIITGSCKKRLDRPEGEELKKPIIEFCYKSDELGDPLINDDHAIAFGWATEAELAEIRRQTLAVNALLRPFFAERGILLVDFKLEFGRTADGRVLLGDEICPDTCRFWDAATRKKLDKDRFRQDLGEVSEAYLEIDRRTAV
ncbi:MAG TPA: phosphoribosylaminoimidazolesuccinocarboxamide synthase [Candidatus Limnocylindrales bacterium]|nr:phosphoribosylaminoimidazolesuccinocarboxamide synthase [Candidatus Limnocylindrales bacterium]